MRAADRIARLHETLPNFVRNYQYDTSSDVTLAAHMPLLHQDSARGSGGGVDERRSLVDLLGLDSALDAMHHMPIDGGGSRDAPRSPEEAHSPRSRVPDDCFPPRNTSSYASYSENARPGTGWSDESGNSGHAITDLVSSLKALAAPSTVNNRHSFTQASIHLHLSYDDQNENTWSAEPNNNSNLSNPLANNLNSSLSSDAVKLREKRDNLDRDRGLLRRASFCGVASPPRESERCVRWTGQLPERAVDISGALSTTVFIGGLPWETSEQALLHSLRHFQPVRVDWPGREGGEAEAPRGFAYVTLESERRVRALLQACRRERARWYYRVAARHLKTKEAQVIPWSAADAVWAARGAARLAPARTVFVGALHGTLTAPALAHIMHDLFGGVLYAGIDTDKNKYPIGSGRVTFDNVRSYVRAISAAHVVIDTDKFSKKIQVDPYLEDSMCSVCNLQQGPYFCREPVCYRYYCRWCWSCSHAAHSHRPLMRSARRARAPPPGHNPLEGTSSPPPSCGSPPRPDADLTWH